MTTANLLKSILHDVTEAAWGQPVHEVLIIPKGATPWTTDTSTRVNMGRGPEATEDLLEDLESETCRPLWDWWLTEDDAGFRTLWAAAYPVRDYLVANRERRAREWAEGHEVDMAVAAARELGWA